MADGNNVINDPKFVPLATHDGTLLWTHDQRVLIVSSSLGVRNTDATRDGNTRSWLKTPIRHIRSGGGATKKNR